MRLRLSRGSKHKNKHVRLDGYTFDSQAEARRYQDLKLLLKAGKVEKLKVHPVYEITVMDIHIGDYEADFVYFDVELGREITEDVKGQRTDLYRWKKNLMKAIYGIDIKEVEA